MKIIKDTAIVEDNWQLIREPEIESLPDGDIIVPYSFWKEHSETLNKGSTQAVWIDGSFDVEEIVNDLEQFTLIALDFPAFADGRCYSHARLLKERYGFKGDLRAIGDVLQDQLFYLYRCGFDSFALRDDKDFEAALKAFNTFSVRYQAASDEALPLYRRR